MSFVALGVGVGALGVGLGAVGLYQNNQAQKGQAAANQQVLQGQQALEAQNQQAMDLDALRRQRELVRQGQASRSQSLAVASNQGAGGGSGIAGAYGGISGTVNNAENATSQSQEIGNNKFAINQGITNAQINASNAGSRAATAAGLSSLGGSLAKNSGTISQVGQYGYDKFSSWFGTGSTNTDTYTGFDPNG